MPLVQIAKPLLKFAPEADYVLRVPRARALLLALALGPGLPIAGAAQQVDRAVAGVRPAIGGALGDAISRRGVLADTARADSVRRRPIGPYLLGGAVVGAVVFALLAQSFHDSFCDEPRPGYSCSTTSPAAAAAMGAGLGLIVGGFVWVVTRSRGLVSSPRSRQGADSSILR